jgi:hypothetical protein
MRVIIVDPANRAIHEDDFDPRLYADWPDVSAAFDSLEIFSSTFVYLYEDGRYPDCWVVRERHVLFGYGLITGGSDTLGFPLAPSVSCADVGRIVRFPDISMKLSRWRP